MELGIPKGVTASTPQPTRLLLEGPEREVVMQFAANIKAWRRPEPYKGKGIFVNGETIKLKNKKIKEAGDWCILNVLHCTCYIGFHCLVCGVESESSSASTMKQHSRQLPTTFPGYD